MSDNLDNKSNRDILVELHTQVCGKNGLMDRMKAAEERMDLEVKTNLSFRSRWGAFAAITGGVIGVASEWLAGWWHGRH